MSDGQSKAERLSRIETLLLEHPEGLRQSDLARMLGVHRSTISRCMPAISSLFPVVEDDEGRITIDRRRYLSRMKVTLNEAMVIYLGARLLYRYADDYNPHVESAVHKLADALHGIAPNLAGDIGATASHMRANPAPEAPNYVRTMETLTEALADRRWVSIRYQPLKSAATESRFAPYVLEPYGPGFATYVIGVREPPGSVYTLKVERIERASLLPENYVVPDALDHDRLLADAWGIWRPGGQGPVEVVLRFSPDVAKRVLETRWHRSESAVQERDGSLTWRAKVGDVVEITPWIRGWGSTVEVLQPPELRAAVADDIRAAAALY